MPWRTSVLFALVCVCACASACGDSRTALPSPSPTGGVTDTSEETTPSTSAGDAANGPLGPGSAPSSTDASGRTLTPFNSPGVRHSLPGGNLIVSYPRVQTRPPPDAPKLPPGQAYWFITVKYCAKDAPIAGSLVDPARFQVEVPGQGYVAWKPETPVVYGEPLTAGEDVAPDTCREGTISYIIGGELHIESITFDAGSTLLRWAS